MITSVTDIGVLSRVLRTLKMMNELRKEMVSEIVFVSAFVSISSHAVNVLQLLLIMFKC